ncbi:MAG: hypothetical protein RM049_38115 [Nostoc sp. DedQUE04]|uniref:hypothetical protein n=1 Tax=Nostoc sp. DedQUE04 TaxID=3075390 RepID=UPI002AD5A1EA|nr:hypothetical protein [Nostoc sp. DedQUE04]MDZ8141040.1 hypothetical protein [Nostoc sp. DedQUE04]
MKLLERKELNLTPIFLIGNAALLTMLLLIEVLSFARIATISKTKASTLVELSDGESIRVIPIGSLERTPQAITHFVGQTMTGLLSWNALPKPTDDYKIDPSKQLKLDAGISTSKAKITTSTWAWGFALSEDFRASFLEEIGNLTPPDVFNGSTQSILKVSLISQPTPIKDGQWKVDMVAELVVFQGSNLVGKPIAFNKTVFVRAIDTAALPRFASDVQETASRVRKAGLEIYKIQDLDL